MLFRHEMPARPGPAILISSEEPCGWTVGEVSSDTPRPNRHVRPVGPLEVCQNFPETSWKVSGKLLNMSWKCLH